jgi:hypothetical protein
MNELRQILHDLAGAEHDRRKHHEVGAFRRKLAPWHELELDAALLAVDAQDEVDRVELAVARHDPGSSLHRIQDRAQALAGARLRHDAVQARRADELRGERAEALARLEPLVPGAVHVAVPRVERGAHVVGGAVGRPPERMVGEVDLLAPEHAAEAREHLAL